MLMMLGCVSVFGIGASAASAMTLKADKSKASIGEIVTVSVRIPSGLSGIAGRLEYDSSYLSVVSTKVTGKGIVAALSKRDGIVGFTASVYGFEKNHDGTYKLDENGNKIEIKEIKEGELFTVTFKVLKMGAKLTVTPSTESEMTIDANNNDVYVAPATLTIKAGDKAINFPDVREGDWFYEAVEYCAVKGYILGYNDGKFGPADAIQRQDFVVIFSRIDGADLSSYKNKTGGFGDVKAGAYYAPAVAWGAQKGIITGYNASKFGVGDTITREQVCTIIYRYMGSPAVSDADGTLAKFADRAKISAYAYDALAWCVENGIISGKTATTVAPNEGASRAQIATIIMRMDKQGMFND